MKASAVAAALAAVCLAGCASTSRVASYTDGLTFDGQVMVEGHQMALSIHPSDDTLLLQRGVRDSFAKWLPSGPQLDAALSSFVSPSGCSVQPARPLGDNGTSYEASFVCPAGKSLRAMMSEQREAIRRGEPLRP